MNTDLNQTYNAIYVLESRGRLGIDYNDMAGTMMEAIRLSQKVITQQGKFDQYIYDNYPNFAADAPNYRMYGTKFMFTPEGGDEEERNGDTIILRNTMFVTKIDNSTIAIDINGRKKPNQTGRDIFFYHFTTLGNCGEGLSGEINFGGFCKPPTVGAPQCCIDIDDTCAINGDWAHSRGCATKYLQAGRIEDIH